MTIEHDLARRLTEAQRAGSRSVDQDAFNSIDRAAAYRIQGATMQALDVAPSMFKVAVARDGSGVIAPIYGGRVGQSGGLQLSSASVTGLEVEIGVAFARDIAPGADRATVDAAVGRYFAGIEICGTRFADRTRAAFDTGLADNMSAFGYAIGGDWERRTDIGGLTIDLSFNGAPIFSGPAKHGFGGVLEALYAYASMAEQPYPLAAGTILTTGSMCGLVPTSGPGIGIARLGNHSVEVELT